MREETIKIYSFDELSDSAKEAARNHFRQSDCWNWSEEWWQSAQAFSRIAPIDIREADCSRRNVTIQWQGDNSIRELSGLRAWKWLLNNNWFEWARKNKAGDCTLTGFCGDRAFADTIAQYEKNPQSVPDLEQLFYEFTESGNLY